MTPGEEIAFKITIDDETPDTYLFSIPDLKTEKMRILIGGDIGNTDISL